ncbi:hypothetical protein [Novosphingobium guangzhouense]|uniref:Uncharacterized protein n=1 Tax=Novosphingobium guangzhouense TaxID=1850347 RepID=A0A2K2FYS8_9SPHN|nr:hypothetical protein [Novosphingobium guangzhouense]PNU03941.1 hypothetical protein A8V01_04770 [Novosphingobium guangzhouense]
MSGLRDLDPALQAEIEKSELRPFMGVHIDLPDPVYAVTGNATIHYGGEEWSAIGGLGQIDTVGEGTDGSAVGVKATLYQVPSEFRDDIADQAVRGCLYELYVGALDPGYREVVGFKNIWKGRLDTYEIVDAGETITVTAGGESRMRDQRRPAIRRFTDWWQQRRYPGDRAFEYVSRMVEVPILWAKSKQDPVL